MDADRLARLTEQQRVCLRLVYGTPDFKGDRAAIWASSRAAVDQHIKAAMRVLGVGDRRAAARMLAEHEGAAEPVVMREEQAAFRMVREREPLLPLPYEGLRPTKVGWTKRLAWISAIAVGCMISFAALIAAAEAFERYLKS